MRALAPRAADAPDRRVRELARRDVVAARGEEQEAARRHQRRRQPRQLGIALERRRLVLAALGEGGRVGDHDVEALAPPRAAHALQLLQRLRAAGLDARREAVLRRGARRRGRAHGRCGRAARRAPRPRRRSGGRSRRCGRRRPAPSRAGGQAGHAVAVLALVEEPAGLLPAEQVHGEAEPALLRPRPAPPASPSSGRDLLRPAPPGRAPPRRCAPPPRAARAGPPAPPAAPACSRSMPAVLACTASASP